MIQVTMEDIAKKAGVSRHTVSKVLNNRECYVGQQTRQKVLSVVKELNYQPNYFARSLKEGKTNIIGITTISNNIGVFEQHYPANIYSGISRFFSDKDYKLIFHNFKQSGSVYPYEELTRTRMVDGIILLLFARDLEVFRKNRVVAQLKAAGMPLVVIHSLTEDFGCPAVGLDTRYGGYLATRHLLEHGYQEVGFIGFKRMDWQQRDYIAGYRQALAEGRIKENGEFTYTATGAGSEDGYRLASDLLEQEKHLPRALVVFTDEVAFGMIAAFREAGVRVPEDIALTSFRNDNHAALLLTGLTTVHEPAQDKGYKAAEMLLKMLDDPKKKPKPFFFKPKLIKRTSCGC